jgi:hypothetical protein
MSLKLDQLLPFASLVTLLGCAHAGVAPLRVRAGDSEHWPAKAPDQALIIDFKAGDRIPVSIQVDGEIVETTPNPSTVFLTAKRDFSVRINNAEIKTSLDGIHFDVKPAVPGHFQLGLQAARSSEPKVVVHVTTPVHGKP